MAHISLDKILEWEKNQSVYTFDVLNKEHFDVELKRYTPDSGQANTNHTHDMDELYYIISGSGMASVGDDTYSVKEGEMIFVEQGVEHEFYDIADEITVLKVLAGTEDQY
jgi:mannose-1-phosphate guanylyltransferase